MLVIKGVELVLHNYTSSRGMLNKKIRYKRAFGEKINPSISLRIYGHLYGQTRIESLVKVPWFICKEVDNLKKVKRLKRKCK